MTRVVDPGEPVSRGRRDLGAAERKARGDALFSAAFFTIVVLANGILAILGIALLEAVGLWGVSAETTEEAAAAVSQHVRASRLALE
jgi:hypothetical protein